MTQTTRFTLQVDKFGRVVIPKKVREALNLREGSTLQADMRDGELTLTREGPRYRIEHSQDGWPLIHLEGVTAADFADLDCRDDRTPEELAAWA
ncbi:AbrB/MazE/SpoVT family DNA-binding domain-containing protein [Deinococcus sp. VB343]|uniref:AbrB/MazE/SpoVT family DNA-binding domain-containing protein n=1 Tax=Deinococcus sp. VB142 TaxID=3112952 RepID=A0AAU6Q0C9_9DEIO